MIKYIIEEWQVASLTSKLQSFKKAQTKEDEELRDLTTFTSLAPKDRFPNDRIAQLFFNDVDSDIDGAVKYIAEYKNIEPTQENLSKLKEDLIQQKLLNAES